MLKKFLSYFLILAIFATVVACAAEPEEPSPSPTPTPVTALPLPEPTPEPEPEPEPEFAPLSSTMVEVEFHDLIFTFSEDIIYIFTEDHIMDLVYPHESSPSTRIIQDSATLTDEFANSFFDALTVEMYGDREQIVVNDQIAYKQYYNEGDSVLILFSANHSTYVITFTGTENAFDFFYSYFLGIVENMQVMDLPTNILDDSDLLDRLVQYTLALEFDEIVRMVDDYLSVTDTDETDVAFEIRDLATRGLELMEIVDVEVDEFDGQITIYYPGVREISTSINIVPFIRPEPVTNTRFPRASFYLTQGFIRSGWLFFDRIELRMVDDDIRWKNHGHFDVSRDVIRGGTISEIVTENWSLVNAGRPTGYLANFETKMSVDYDHVMRFRNTGEDTNHDVTLSDAEILAVSTLAELFNIMARLADRIPDDFQ